MVPGITPDECLQLTDYDPAWAGEADEAIRLVSAALWSTAVEHIGSTAVPGMAARPVIDLMADISSAEVDRARALLRSTGFADNGPSEAAGGHHLSSRTGFPVDVYLISATSPQWRHNVVLREYLRAHPEAVERYEEVKTDPDVQRHPQRYAAAKARLLGELIAEARSESEDGGW